MKVILSILLAISIVFPERSDELVTFDNIWSSPYTVDPKYPHHFVNKDDQHLYLFNKSAFAYFKARSPEKIIEKARKQGVNVLRVCLEGRPFYDELNIDLWPWAGNRQKPDYTKLNEAYWTEVERRIEMAGEAGIGFNIILYYSYFPLSDQIEVQKLYWNEVIERLGKYANVFMWEIAQEYTRNEPFQDTAGMYFKDNDPYHRPVISSQSTSDDALWPEKSWMSAAVVHTSTGKEKSHDLASWYLSIARNLWGYNKPVYNNQSGSEILDGNNDPVYRRKQSWLWTNSGGYWTWHSLEGCSEINNDDYFGPGWQYLRPLITLYSGLEFWKLYPNFTTIQPKKSIISTTLADNERSTIVMYCCTENSGDYVRNASADFRLNRGTYEIKYMRPSDLTVIEQISMIGSGIHQQVEIPFPDFMDDLLVVVKKVD